MKRLIASLALALASLTAAAQAAPGDTTVNWTHPVQNTDGSALPLANIASTRVERGICTSGTFGTKQNELIIPAPATSALFPALPPGNWAFRAYTKATAAAGGLESGPSAVACKLIPFPTPNPPVITTVTTAVNELKPNGKLGAIVGTVALNEACGALITTQGNRKYYELGLDQVDLDRMPNSAVIVGQCEPALAVN